jgi:hypothetical protein
MTRAQNRESKIGGDAISHVEPAPSTTNNDLSKSPLRNTATVRGSSQRRLGISAPTSQKMGKRIPIKNITQCPRRKLRMPRKISRTIQRRKARTPAVYQPRFDEATTRASMSSLSR